ncbi:glycosyltransferase [Escherichia albertii]|uniref:glycosyltransferase n=1 Tax=Escherichia albertii TaxID=208962 RepID=UPI00236188C3|nr:glycosyltransferase [Escherichia albertii]WDC36146.1 glycosyltransferase [Escherichia albertii]
MNKFITITVISYNSSATISDTLNSILQQTYNKKNIEVIISDDASKDNTLLIANDWKDKNKDIFNNIVIVSHSENKGVASNCNQAWKLAKGEWIKTIAADDMLLPNCIEENIKYVLNNSDTKIIFSDMIPFTSYGYEEPMKHDKKKINCSHNQQKKNILYQCYLLAPTAFINRKVLTDVGYADEAYPMIEDYPLWLRCLNNGYKFSYMEKNTVIYRQGDSLSQQNTKIGNIFYMQSLYSFQKEKIWPQLPKWMIFKKWDDYILYKHKKFWIKKFGNEITFFYRVSRKMVFLLRPYKMYLFVKKIIMK